MTTPAGTPAPSPRRYQVGDTIPGHGVVTVVTLTAYRVEVRRMGETYPDFVPFYGPNGVDEQAPVAGLVEFADGSRYGGAR